MEYFTKNPFGLAINKHHSNPTIPNNCQNFHTELLSVEGYKPCHERRKRCLAEGLQFVMLSSLFLFSIVLKAVLSVVFMKNQTSTQSNKQQAMLAYESQFISRTALIPVQLIMSVKNFSLEYVNLKLHIRGDGHFQ